MPVREFLAVLLSLSLLAVPAVSDPAGNHPYLDAALATERWIRASAIRSDLGTVWPSDPRDPRSVSTNLYTGTPGVVLFYTEAYRSTRDPQFLDAARSGARALLPVLETEKDTGLYTGIAGIGFALAEAYKISHDPELRKGVERSVGLLKQRARKAGAGVEWSETTDVIGGGAGTGLFLLYAARALNDKSAKDLAIQAGLRLIELAKPEKGGLKWPMTPTYPRLMPNFSHGTAGVAYFLATLFQQTRRRQFLDAALPGARYLQSVAFTEGNICLIFHNEPFDKNLYYLGWCHGPAGTARLFYRLYQVTGDRKWMDWAKKSANAILKSGIPEKRTPGFWNNVGQCCGSAGVAKFFLDLYRVTRDPEYLAFARRVAADLLARATREGESGSAQLKWIQAEHRLNSNLLIAQTGYMQGAAGIGMLLLHLDAFDRARRPAIAFPDSPF